MYAPSAVPEMMRFGLEVGFWARVPCVTCVIWVYMSCGSARSQGAPGLAANIIEQVGCVWVREAPGRGGGGHTDEAVFTFSLALWVSRRCDSTPKLVRYARRSMHNASTCHVVTMKPVSLTYAGNLAGSRYDVLFRVTQARLRDDKSTVACRTAQSTSSQRIYRVG